jgi:Fungal specific transcription factor domain
MTAAASSSATRKSNLAPEKRYKCQFCSRAFSRSEHRSRHERSRKCYRVLFSETGGLQRDNNLLPRVVIVFLANVPNSIDTKERPFKCLKCRSTFVRRDLLLRHDRTVHRKDGGVPLHSEVKRRAGAKNPPVAGPSKPSITIDTAALEQIEASSEGMLDLETAAMLMTDMHHKATAAMSSQPAAFGAGLETAISPSGAALLESSVTYPSGAVSLPQVPWDTFMPTDVTESKAHSISSSASGSQESQSSQISFTSVSTLQPPNPNQLPPIMERSFSAGDLLAPVQPQLHSLQVSGADTPGAYSPYPYLAGPASPLEYRRSPGPPGGSPPKAPQVETDEERDTILGNIRDIDSERDVLDSFRLPSRIALNRYLATYFNLFHHHMPFLHPASFQPPTASPPLLLAVLSIGALYAFEQEQAYMFHIGSKVLVNQFLQKKENFSSRKCPLWTMQSSLLNMIFASWSGDPKGLEWACSIKSLLANVRTHLIPNITLAILTRQ